MAVPKTVAVQTDFSAGELDPTAKRGDSDKELRSGLRQCANMRLLNTDKATNRQGRTAKFIDGPRVDEVLMSPGNVFELCFSAGKLTVRDANGTVLFTSTKLGDGTTNIPWTANNVNQIDWDTDRLAVYICFPGIVPQVLSWDGVSVWSIATYAETVTASNQKRTVFYRLAAKSMTLQPSGLAVGASITLTTSAPYFVNGMVGTRIRYAGRQVLVTGVTNPTTATATVQEELDPSQQLNFTSDPRALFFVGDLVTNGAAVLALVVETGVNFIVVQYGLFGPNTSTGGFVNGNNVIGSRGQLVINTVSANANPTAIAVWDEEVMNAFRGYPTSVFADQNRVGFCGFPALQDLVVWSAINTPNDLYPHDASSPDNAIAELAPGKAQVRYVIAGAESSEFVFCDNAVYYIPITPTNPLKPGSVGFQRLSSEGSSAVRPRRVQETILYVPAGGNAMRAITATGAYQRPFEVKQISETHDHLFDSIVAIASPGASDPNFPEQYSYVLNGDGTVAVARFSIENGQVKEFGWVPWSGVGAVKWVSSRLGTPTVWFTTTYPTGPVTVAEVVDFTQYLDAALPVNNVPAALTPPGGKGPLWWYAGGSVSLMDQTTRMMGTYQVDANGFIVPQNNAGENLNAASLVAGQPWMVILEPFVPGVQEGPEGQGGPQRMRKRRVARDEIYVQESTGFVIQSLRNGVPQAQRRIPTWNQDEDPTQPPPLREMAYAFRFKGRDHDPRHVLIKDTPGPLTILEWSREVTW